MVASGAGMQAPTGRTAMQTFMKCFVRDNHGAWRCIEPATLDLPSGRIQVTPGSVFTRGTMFMNIEVAKILDEEYEKARRTQ
jgi:hypothetical protein